jgi:hypothetical protein
MAGDGYYAASVSASPKGNLPKIVVGAESWIGSVDVLLADLVQDSTRRCSRIRLTDSPVRTGFTIERSWLRRLSSARALRVDLSTVPVQCASS